MNQSVFPAALGGSMVALVTPFEDDGARPDYRRWRALVEWHASAGTRAVVVAGTTGESATLSTDERDRLLDQALESADGRLTVLAGTGGASTAAVIEQSRRAAARGCDAVLVVTPYYNRPPQRGLLAHYRCIAEGCDVPVVLYNVPSRTAVDLAPETVLALAEHPNIVAIKEAVADMQRVARYAESGLTVLSGDDPTALEAMRHGAAGVISVAANVVPGRFAALCRAAGEAAWERAADIDRELRDLYAFLAAESNPIPVKWLLAEVGRIGPAIRLPLVELAERHRAGGAALLRLLESDAPAQ